MGLLSGKSALITGAGRGIGRAMAERFAAEGATLFLAVRISSRAWFWLVSCRQNMGLTVTP